MKASVRNEILDQLVSLDEEVVNKALNKIRKNGDHSFVAPLMNTMARSDNEMIVASIAALFFDLKDKPSMEVLLDLLPEEAYNDIRRVLLEAVWQSGQDVSSRLMTVIDIAIIGDYMECLECLTIIENMETLPPEPMVAGAVKKIKLHQLEDVTEKEDLLLGIVEVLENFRNA